MSAEKQALTGLMPADFEVDKQVAFHGGRYYGKREFFAMVRYWAGRFNGGSPERYALFTETAYPFAVYLLALCHAGKEIWLPGNNRPGTADQLQQSGCELIGDWGNRLSPGFSWDERAGRKCIEPLLPLNKIQTRLVMYTSGSSGLPKAIAKTLAQLEAEAAVLEALWGEQLGDAEVLSTVSHQHIYGLLFRVLWPLSAGRCFHSAIYLDPEMLFNNAGVQAACWVASPAQLKRLDKQSPWQAIAGLKAIFSSGGVLPGQAAAQIHRMSGQQVIEVYGSTETGGIAWKSESQAWTLFPGMSLEKIGERWSLMSPYLGGMSSHILDDRIAMLDDGRFLLEGRLDRIVKIEEKRLSLTEMEQRLKENPSVEEACVLKLSRQRDVVCAVLKLTGEGEQLLSELGRNTIITRQFKKSLSVWFDAVVVPRKWLFVNEIPLTAQGKIDFEILSGVLDTDVTKYPLVQGLNLSPGNVQVQLIVPGERELLYFPDHFPGYPILPGVVQLAWAEHFGRLFFAVGVIEKPFSHLETIKFIKIIPPGAELVLTLKWNERLGELCFSFKIGSEKYSSGRMMYKTGERRAVDVI